MPVFVFTDIEGSTRHWSYHQQAMAEVLQRHNKLLQDIILHHGGQVIEFTGDGIYAVFESGRPLAAAIDIQERIAQEDWGEIKDFRLRIGLNAETSARKGIAYFQESNRYFGLAVSQTFRIMSAGSGGQILLTPAVLNFDKLPNGAELQDLGSHMLKSLDQPQKIYSLTHPSLPWQEFPQIDTLSTRPNNLPPQSTPFVARQTEVALAVETLKKDSCRLLTLFGPGGVGKTRLAIQTAAELISDYQEGVFFIPLAPVRSPAHMVSNIAATLNFSFHGSENQKLQLLNYLRRKQLLLIMDNFEHLLEGVGLMADILEAAPQIKILSTCRERLNFAGEQVLEIQGLDIPESDVLENLEQHGIIQLFLNAARRSNPQFTLKDEETSAVIRICQLVAGMPLGLELAAAWVRIYSCKEIADKIEQNLQFLESTRPDIPNRHRNLYAVCDYFWEQLSEGERAILRKLSIFRGGFHSQAAWHVAGASTFFLSALMDRAFLRKVTISAATRKDISSQAEAWRVRYEMHAVLRQFSAEKLANHSQEFQQAQTRHGSYFADFLHHREERLKGKEQQAALEQIMAEIDNIRSAWKWAINDHQFKLVEKAFPALDQSYHHIKWLDEGAATFELAAREFKSLGSQQNELVSKLLIRQARFLAQSARFEEAETFIEESKTLVNGVMSPVETAFCYQIYGRIARVRGSLEKALTYLEKGLSICRDIKDDWAIAGNLIQISDCNYRMGNFEQTRTSYWESFNIYRRIGNPRGMALTLTGLGVLLHQLGEAKNAGTLLQESIKLNRSINDRYGLAISIHNLGAITLAGQDYRTARSYLEESLSLFQEMDYQYQTAAALSALGIASYELGDIKIAKENLVEALKLTNSLGFIPVLLETLVQTAVVANNEGQPELAAKILAFCLVHPALDKAETEGHALKIWGAVTDRLSYETVQLVRQEGEQLTLAEVVAEATYILTQLGDDPSHESNRFSHRISQ